MIKLFDEKRADFRRPIVIRVGMPLVAPLVLWPLCPENDHVPPAAIHEHVPHTEFVVNMPVVSMLASGSSSPSDPPMTWQNNSTFAAADVVVNGARARQDAQTRIAGMSSMSSPAVLLST